jgi:peptide/nickel transport system substrate-binding protein
MNSSILTPRRIFIAVAILALLLMLRECFKNRGSKVAAPDQVIVRFDAAASNLNPILATQGSDIYACARIFQTLGDLYPSSESLQPTLIKKIPTARPVSSGPHAGQLAYDFEILPEAMWDNGTPVTGKDMAFTMKLVFHPLLASKAYLSYLKDLSGIDIDPSNPKKFTVYFRQYYMLALESMCQTPILPMYHYDSANRLTNIPIEDFIDTIKLKALATDAGVKTFSDEFNQAKFTNDPASIVGSGAYKLQQMNDQGVILVKKENWWGDKIADKHPNLVAYPKRLVYKVVKDENVLENMLKKGELDIVAGSISFTKFLEMKNNDSLKTRYNFDVLPPMQYNRVLTNLTKPNLKDVKVRRALAHIIDYDHFIKNIRSGMAVRTVGPILPSKRFYAKNLKLYDFNIQKAKDLLAEAGWKDSNNDGIVDKMVDGKNVKLVIEVLVPPIRANQQYAESFTETARLAGIEIKSVETDLTAIGPLTRSGNFEIAFLGNVVMPGLTELSQKYHSKYLSPIGDNRARYINPTLDSIIDRIGAEPDDAKRDALYLDAQQILHDDLPEIFLFAPNQPIVTAKKFDAVVSPNRPGYYEHFFKLKAAN